MTRGGFISLPVGGVSIVGLPWWDLRSPHHASAWRASPRALTRSRALHDGGHWHRRRLGLGGLSLCARREQTFVFSRLALGESRRSCSRALRSERADVRVLALCARREQTFVFSRFALGESRRSCSRALRSERADVRVLALCARREQTFVFSRLALGESRRSCSRALRSERADVRVLAMARVTAERRGGMLLARAGLFRRRPIACIGCRGYLQGRRNAPFRHSSSTQPWPPDHRPRARLCGAGARPQRARGVSPRPRCARLQ
jgi:hypothetical protein